MAKEYNIIIIVYSYCKMSIGFRDRYNSNEIWIKYGLYYFVVLSYDNGPARQPPLKWDFLTLHFWKNIWDYILLTLLYWYGIEMMCIALCIYQCVGSFSRQYVLFWYTQRCAIIKPYVMAFLFINWQQSALIWIDQWNGVLLYNRI